MCIRERSQGRFTAGDLARMLQGGFPIEAYCEACDVFWPISLRKRIELAGALVTTSERQVGSGGSRA